MDGGPPKPHRHVGSQESPLSNWPRYPGGAIAGALFAVFSVALFFLDTPALRSYLSAARIVVVVLWGLVLLRPRD
jgi:hypothetical protein